jgi:hypothetical protein
VSPAGNGRPPRIAVVADDLIWATRLVDAVRRAGADPVPVRRSSGVQAALAGAAGVIVDTTARAYDPLEVLRLASAAGVPAIAAAPHDDVALRRAALAAGASRVHPYRVLHERGDRELAAWIGSLPAQPAADVPEAARPAAEEAGT